MGADHSTRLSLGGGCEGEEDVMSDGLSRVCAIVGAMSMILLGVGCVAVEAGHEGVLVEQPFFFGLPILF